MSGGLLACALGALPGLGLAVAMAEGWISQRVGLALFALSYVGLNLAHFGATWARTYLEPGFAARRPVERVVVPAALVALALAVDAAGRTAWLLGAQFYLSFHHALMQNHGIARAAHRAGGRVLDGRIDLVACLGLPLAALMARASAINATYNGVRVVAPPTAIVAAVAIVGAAALTMYVHREVRAWRRERIDPLPAALVVGVNGAWSIALLALDDPLTPFYAIASAHYVQYLWFVGRWTGTRRPLRWTLALGAGAAAVVAALSVIAAVARLLGGPRPEGDVPPWAAAVIAVNLSHYWLDARIWRRGA